MISLLATVAFVTMYTAHSNGDASPDRAYCMAHVVTTAEVDSDLADLPGWYVQVGDDVASCDAWEGPYMSEEEALDQARDLYSVEDEGSPFNDVGGVNFNIGDE
jgi:hypothetical protein